MLDFFERKPFGAACVGAMTLATCYQADMSDWRIFALPAALVISFYLTIHEKSN
jgi:hypothetical protein